MTRNYGIDPTWQALAAKRSKARRLANGRPTTSMMIAAVDKAVAELVAAGTIDATRARRAA